MGGTLHYGTQQIHYRVNMSILCILAMHSESAHMDTDFVLVVIRHTSPAAGSCCNKIGK